MLLIERLLADRNDIPGRTKPHLKHLVWKSWIRRIRETRVSRGEIRHRRRDQTRFQTAEIFLTLFVNRKPLVTRRLHSRTMYFQVEIYIYIYIYYVQCIPTRIVQYHIGRASDFNELCVFLALKLYDAETVLYTSNPFRVSL